MNKKDAAVYKALAECGFEFGSDSIPDPEKDRIVQLCSDPNIKHMDDVLRVLGEDCELDELIEKLKNDPEYQADNKTVHNPLT